MARCFLALGSNLGDRREHLIAGARLLEGSGVALVRSASTYSTEPVGIKEQPRFLNTVIEVRYEGTPHDLLDACREAERQRNRRRIEPNGPRTLDVDIIFFGNQTIRDDDLQVPHPRYSGRRFVLEPLAEIAPDFIDPVLGKTVRSLLEGTGDPAEVVREGPPLY